MIKRRVWDSEKLIDFTYPSPVENTPTATDLPTSDPGVGGSDLFSYTVASGFLVSTSMPLAVKQDCVELIVAGQNLSGSTQTVYWRMKKNGSQVATGSSNVSNNYYWTLSAEFKDISVGDVLAVQCWTGASGVKYDYNARRSYLLRFCPWDVGRLCGFLKVVLQDLPSLTLGNPSLEANKAFKVKQRETFNVNYTKGYTSNFTLYHLYNPDWVFTLHAFEEFTGKIITKDWSRPRYYQNKTPDTMRIRLLSKKVDLQ